MLQVPINITQIKLHADVWAELQDLEAPESLRQWIRQSPSWLEVRSVKRVDPSLTFLDAGALTARLLAGAGISLVLFLLLPLGLARWRATPASRAWNGMQWNCPASSWRISAGSGMCCAT